MKGIDLFRLGPTRVNWRLMLAVSFGSGFASLVYQMVWQKCLTQEIGVDSISLSMIVGIFMIGLAFGYYAGGIFSRRAVARLPLYYCLAELTIALFGIASIPLLRGVNHAFVEMSWAGIFTVNGLTLLVPTFCMGVSTPLLMAIVRDDLAHVGRTVGIFYGVNIFGAAFGALATGFVFIELFGFRATTFIAAAINAAVGLAVYGLYRRSRPVVSSAEDRREEAVVRPWAGLSVRQVVAAFLFGFVTLGFEMVAFRVISNQFMTLSYIFPLMLTVYLAQMSLGEYFAGVAIDAWPQRRRTLIFPVIYVCFAGAVLIAFFLKGDGDLIENNPFSYFCAFGTLIHFIVYFLVPVFFLSGFFPAMVRCSVKDPGDTGRVVGLLLFVFTVSSGLASLATPFILFEKFGTIGAVYILSALAALGVFLLSPTLVSLGLVLAGSSLIFFVPRNYYYRLKDYHAKRHPYKIIEDHNGVLHLTPLSDDPATADFLVRMNRTPASGTVRQIPPRTLLQYNGSDMVAADKEFRPKDILVIGLGGGEFVYGMLRYDFVASVTIVELFQSVVDAFRDYSGPEILGALKDPRVTLIIDDGRKYVNRLEGTDKKFDVIQIGVCLPVTAGGSSVYTVDFYQKLKNILKPGGCISILEMQHPVEAGLQVFKWGYKFFGDIGQRQFYLTDKMIDDKASYGVDAKIAAMAAIPDGASMTIYRSHNIRKPFWLNTDDRPIQEFYAIREFLLPKLRFIKPLRRFEWTSSVETTKSPAPAVVNIKADRRDDVPA